MDPVEGADGGKAEDRANRDLQTMTPIAISIARFESGGA